MKRFRGFSIFALLLCLVFPACGGGGGGGAPAFSYSTKVYLGDVTGEIDPDGDGTAVINYFLNYPLATRVDVSIEYSVDGGDTYSSCTEDTVKKIGGEENPTEGISALEAGPGGIEHFFSWDTDSPNDLPDQNLNWVLLRISVDGGGFVVSGYLTVTNDHDETEAPQLAGLNAVAVQGASNDTLTITFSEPVCASEAEDLANFTVQNPAGVLRTIPQGSTVVYNPLIYKTIITLNGNGTLNLKYGTECVVTAADIHDLVGNVIEFGVGDEITDLVGGDGANGTADQPVLELAYFDGGDMPDQGESLYLLFSEEMELDVNQTFDQGDVDFWDAGDTIGQNSPITLVLEDPFTVKIILGINPQFLPNFSRILASTSNDVIADLAGNKPYIPPSAQKSDYELVIYKDEEKPVLDQLTLNEIPDVLNGEGDAGGTLLIPTNGFDITLEYYDVGGAGVDKNKIEIWNDREVEYDGTSLPAGTNLAPYLQAINLMDLRASFGVPQNLVFPNGANAISGRIADRLENLSDVETFSFQVTTPNTTLRPFETNVNASQVWNLIFTRDLWTINVSGSSVITVNSQYTANGKADFDEDLKLYGLWCGSPVPVPGTPYNSNQFLRMKVIELIKDQLSNYIFTEVNIVFTEQNQGTLPGNAPQVPYNSFTHSQICIGGESDVGALGCAFIDRANGNQDNNTLYSGSWPYNPGTTLGVFPTGIYKYEVNGSPMFSLFRQTYDYFIPGRGTPAGEGSQDQDILADWAGTGPEVAGPAALRRDNMINAANRLARFCAVTAAHEMGHSMGVACNKAPPHGLHGGDPLNFPGSDSNHIDMRAFPNIFLVPAVNIMIPATNFKWSNSPGTRFNMLNMGYLREKTFYNP